MIGCHDTLPSGCSSGTTSFNRSASLQEQVARALQANFLLLHQPAPNAFIILDPSPISNCQWEMAGCSSPKRQRFRVTLGGHSPGCSCSEQPLVCPASTRSPCAHTLFVLLRVLRLRLEDPRISRPRLENYEVEPLLQRYARLRASNFRMSGGFYQKDVPSVSSAINTSNFSAVIPSTSCSSIQVNTSALRIVMPRPVVLNAVGTPNPCLLAAVRASSSECSELSNITRSIEPAAAICRRCLSHASSASPPSHLCGGGSGGGNDGSVSGGNREGNAETEEMEEALERRPKTEPQAYYGTLNSQISLLNCSNARHALSTTFRPIGEPHSNPETDPETEGGVSSSSRSSRFEGVGGGQTVSNSTTPEDGDAETSGGVAGTGLCRLCLREFRPLPEPSTAVCSSLDCGASFHQECFVIWQEECENETGSLYCPVCGRVWSNALTPTNPGTEGAIRRVPAPPVANEVPAIPVSTPSASAVLDGCAASFLLLQNQIIPGLKSCLSVWKSVFSEEVAMGIISPYWHVRQSALRQVAKITICRVLMARKASTSSTDVVPTPPRPLAQQVETSSGNTNNNYMGCESLRMSIRLIQYLLSDPADEVFIASLCAFREILGYLICLDTETMTALQRTIAPVLRRLLIFVGGYLTPGYVPINNVTNLNLPAVTATTSALTATAAAGASIDAASAAALSASSSPPPDQHRRANLALATLVELAKGQEGEMSIGRDTSNAEECMSISGLPHLAHFLLRSAKFHQTHLVGRLKLLEKLVEMHCETVAKLKSSGGATAALVNNKRISYRHLCSSLIFARRHVYPPEQPVFPHNLVNEGAMAPQFRRAPSSAANNSVNPNGSPLKAAAGISAEQHVQGVQVSSFACLMEANIKASRLARRVFIAVARALLQEPRSPSTTGNSSLPDAESFVNAEIKLLDVSLAAKLRTKLSDLLLTTNAPTVTAANPFSANVTIKSPPTVVTPSVLMTPTTFSTQLPPPPPPEHEFPPIPPPRRFSQTSKPTPAPQPPAENTRIITPNGVRIALEPAYDHVALSETAGVYSSSEEEEDGDVAGEESLEKLDWEEVGTSQLPQQHNQERNEVSVTSFLPSVPTPAELSALKTALRRAAWSPVPLVTIPNLAQSLDAKDPLKTEYGYKEGMDWLLGPFLGKGAFSLCYQARDIRTGTLMAVKRLRFVGESGSEAEEQLATAMEEVEIMRRLYHPNILRLFGIAYNPEKKHVDIFVEWMPGGSITSLLNQYGAFTETVSLAYILQVIRGISCLHKHGILHRDLKGANLLVDCTGSVVRISDFGASARLGSQGSVTGQFQGQVIGTFAFMAPEVLRGETYGRACDIWSVGCCLLEMLSGKPPWNDSRLTNQYALMFTIASTDQPPPYPKAISPSVKQFLDSCFNRIPEQRPTARRLLQHPVFSVITSAQEPSTDTSKMIPLNRTCSNLSKSFTAVSLSSSNHSSPHCTSRHRALPPVPHENPLPLSSFNTTKPMSPAPNYDKLVTPMPQSRQHQMVAPQRKICRNQ
nr:mitogen activated protein kinase kinase kinase [Hymenolepis microstoma]